MSQTITSSVKTSDSELPYAQFGSGKKTLVILPGLYTKSLMPLAETVANQYQRFISEYKVFLFDRVTKPLQGYSAYDMAEDTICAMDSLSLKDCYVLGVSAGGIVGQIIAARRPDLVKKLALSSTSAKETALSKKIFEEWRALAQSGNQSALNESFARNVYTGTFYQKYKEAILSSLDGATNEDLERFAIFVSSLLGIDVTKECSSISCPLLAVGAEEDNVFGYEAAQELSERSHGKYILFKGYGHAVYDEAPDFLDKIQAFFVSR